MKRIEPKRLRGKDTVNKILIIITALVIALFVVFEITRAEAADYYMMAGGTAASYTAATGPCGTQAASMSIATHQAAGTAFEPGDTIWISDDGGDYSTTFFVMDDGSSQTDAGDLEYRNCAGDTPDFTHGGTHIFQINEDNYITLTGLNFSGYTTDKAGVYVNKSLGVTIQNCTFNGGSEDSDTKGIYVVGESDNCIIQNNTIQSLNQGIAFQSDVATNTNVANSCLVSGNTIFNLNKGTAGQADGISFIITAGVSRDYGTTTIEDNNIYNFLDQAIDLSGADSVIVRHNLLHDYLAGAGDGNCLKLDSNANNSGHYIVKNAIYNCGGSSAVYIGESTSSIIGNTISGSLVAGIESKLTDDGCNPVATTDIINNIITNVATGGTGSYIAANRNCFDEIDYNSFYLTGAKAFNFTPTTYNTLADAQAIYLTLNANGPSNPTEVDPQLMSATNLKPKPSSVVWNNGDPDLYTDCGDGTECGDSIGAYDSSNGCLGRGYKKVCQEMALPLGTVGTYAASAIPDGAVTYGGDYVTYGGEYLVYQ